MESYRRTLGWPAWGVYDSSGILVATCRAPDIEAAKAKLAPYANGKRRLRRLPN
jgi:hypothetical protein